MDERYRRLQEEEIRRKTQRKIFYENRLQAHKKLTCRDRAKEIANRIRKGALRTLEDIGFMEQDPLEDIKMQFVPWLFEETVFELSRRQNIEETAAKLLEIPIQQIADEHTIYLTQEKNRLRKIKEAEEKAEREFQEARKQRRARRALQRLARDKTRFRDAIEQRSISQRKVDNDIFHINYVDFEDDLPERGSRVLGGLLFELCIMITNIRKVFHERHEAGFEMLLLEADLRHLLIGFFQGIGDRTFRINFSGELIIIFNSAFKQMKENLFIFDEKRPQIMQELADLGLSVIRSRSIEIALERKAIEESVLIAVLKFIFEMIFKSSDYKIPEEEKKLEESEINKIEELEGETQEVPNDGDKSPIGSKKEAEIKEESSTPKYVIPDIKPEDKTIESLVSKLDIRLLASSENETELEVPPGNRSVSIITGKKKHHYQALVRMRPCLNYDYTPEEESVHLVVVDEKSKKKKEEEPSVSESQAELEREEFRRHGRDYLKQEYEQHKQELAQIEKEKQEEADRLRKEEYIEQYYGDRYPNELKEFPVLITDRPTTLIPNEGAENVLFINYINSYNLRTGLEERIRDIQHKEMAQVKDVKFTSLDYSIDSAITETITAAIVSEPDSTPIFDFEL